MSDFRFIAGTAVLAVVAGLASGQCDTNPPFGAVLQNDPGTCGQATLAPDPNGGCNEDPIAYQDLGLINGGATITVAGNVGAFDAVDPATGETAAVRDLDWYIVTVPDNGVLTYTVSGFNETNATNGNFLFVTVENASALDCSANLFTAFTPDCGQDIEFNVTAGQYAFIATVTDFGSVAGIDCTTNYVVDVSYQAAIYDCGDPAQGLCSEANGTPGCDDSVCCELVCAIDSLCCEDAWDDLCAGYTADNCSYFGYSCDNPSNGSGPANPAVANDCVIGSIAAGGAFSYDVPVAGEAALQIAFDTTGCNTDGPEQAQCGSGEGFEQINNDIWFVVNSSENSFLNLSTCNGGALWDTKIAIYNYDPLTFNASALPDLFLGCNEDCGDAAFASELVVEVTADSSYLVRVGGYDATSFGPGTLSVSATPIPVYNCAPPEDFATFTQNNDLTVDAPGVACAAENFTTENQFARKFLNRPEEQIGCIQFGIYNGGLSQLANLRVYIDRSVGANPQVADFVELDSSPFYVPGGFLGIATVSYGAQLEVPAGSNLVVEYDSPANSSGFSAVGVNTLGESALTYIRSDACGILDYVSYESIGFPDTAWVLSVVTWSDEPAACPGDFTGDGQINGGDLTLLLAAWGTDDPLVDLSGDGIINGGDLTLLLAAWGLCP
ncbi:MAG: hypothetical protein VXY94_08200 [Planctomycetota bacterium]|nr:hypothetical protein [Planctomycetota bacterium]